MVGRLPRIVAATALALVVPAAAASASVPREAPTGFFGVHPRSLVGTDPSDYERMAAADVGVIRTGFIYGSAKPKRSGPYDWDEFDAVVAGAARNEIDLLPVLYGVPPWISTKQGAIPLGSAETEWVDYLRSLAARYGPGGDFWGLNPTLPYRPISDWQIWNEENALTNWKLDPDPRAYGRLLVLSADALHTVDPEARVVTGGVIANPKNAAAPNGVPFLQRTFRSKPARRATDVVAIHPYATWVKNIKPELRALREMLAGARMDAVPIWVTEIGWGSGEDSRNALIVSAARQMENLRKSFELALRERRRLGIERMIWYQWRDGPNDTCLWCPTAGLLEADGTAKPLLGVFSSIARR